MLVLGQQGGLMISLGAARKGSEVTSGLRLLMGVGGVALGGREEFVVFGSVRRWLLKMRVGEDLAWVVGGEVEGAWGGGWRRK